MKRTKNLGLWLFLLIVVIIFVLPIPLVARILIVVLFVAAILFRKRSVFYYLRANRKVTSTNPSNWDLAWPLYRKAIDAGLEQTFVITAASMFLQRGDAKEGQAIIETYLASPKKHAPNLDNVAKTMVSMAYWMEGDLQKALDTVTEVYESGYRDKNLYINYTTYLLEQGDTKKAAALLDESQELEETSPGLKDNRGWILLQEGKWEKAEALYSVLVERKPRFPEPYVHYAQVKIHYGLVGEALALLKQALEARFSNTSGIPKQMIESLTAALENPQTRRKTAKEIDADPLAVASGNAPKPILQSFAPEEGLVLDGFAPKVQKKAKKAENPEEERMPNTELTEADIAYAKKHELTSD
ncbi:MAG: pilus assembly protein PilF [Sphaerochaeta sp.]|jgi:tetratricopeptide (TPR) repeat protein|uniref:tetratricopeptide repeat protein n=1 Tax=Sphaerochaeta sp. TaxID=1972642 RepID=UPI002FC76B50